MSRPQAVWQLAEADEGVCRDLAAGLGVSSVVAQILYQRGICTVVEARDFLTCALEDLPDPFLLYGMEQAVKRILDGLQQDILVYGDYDVDGVTSTTLLLDALQRLGCEAGFYIPDRAEEGYGLNKEALSRIAGQGYKLVITVDCGISAVAEAEYARELGLDLIITDHHQPPEIVPPALAVINPKQENCPYPFKDLAGVGVAFKLAQALFKRAGLAGAELELLDLVTLGTIADMVSLTGENRKIVANGLNSIRYTKRIGLQCLIEVAGLGDKEIGPGQVGFALAPRINATGRIGDAGVAVRLLRTDDVLRAREMAEYLDSENRARQELETAILQEALAMLEDFDSTTRFIVLARQGWHPGVIGIVASRLVERYYRPVMLIALDGEEGKGSGRSVPGIDLYEVLSSCADILERFGGHKQAAGLAVKLEQIEKLRQRLNLALAGVDADIFSPKLGIDAKVSLQEVNAGLVEELASLGPFGIGNRSPVLMAGNLGLCEARGVGRDKSHLKIKVQEGNVTLDGIGFSLMEHFNDLEQTERVDIAFSPEFNEYNGKVSVQLQLKDLRSFKQNGIAVRKVSPAGWPGLTIYEEEILTQLAQDQSVRAVQKVGMLFPLMAAIQQRLRTGLSGILIYPTRDLCEWVLQRGRPLLQLNGLEAGVLGGEEPLTGLLLTDFAYLPKLKETILRLDHKVSLVVTDCLANELTFAVGSPVLCTNTSADIISALAPDRQRLGRLYKLLQAAADSQGCLGEKPQTLLAKKLGETTEFIATGLEIFEQLSIIKRKTVESKRIFYFQAPSTKLDLAASPCFGAGQSMLRQYTTVVQGSLSIG